MSWFIILAILILSVAFIITSGFLAHKWATFLLIAAVVLADYAINNQLYTWFMVNMWPVLGWYAVGGLTVCIIRWTQYNFRVADSFTKFRKDFDKWWDLHSDHVIEREGDGIEVKRKRFVSQWNDLYRYSAPVIYDEHEQWGPHLFVPKAKKHVGMITEWIVAWPSVVVYMILSDLVLKCSKHIAVLFDWALSKTFKQLFKKQLTGL